MFPRKPATTSRPTGSPAGPPPSQKSEARRTTPSSGGPKAANPEGSPSSRDEAMDHETQAATLAAASEDGAPFCEECERIKAEEEQAEAADDAAGAAA
jgi:hypothetical protein